MKKNNGFFGEFGGAFVSEPMKKILDELETNFYQYVKDKNFMNEFFYLLKQYVGRPSPLYFAERLTESLGGAKIYLKREDLNHTGSHKINNAIGQALLAKKMGKKRIIAETGAGQHGAATATACALLGLDCIIYMGAKDIERQKLNVFRMELLGAKVVPVEHGTKTLKDAVDIALEDFIENSDSTFYLLGSAVGPHPYPIMVREFQSIIGKETKRQIMELEGRLPDFLIACVGGGSNSIGIFHSFVKDKEVKLVGIEPAGEGLETSQHAASISKGEIGIIHGFKCYTLQDKKGNPLPVHSIAAGLDYPGVGPEHCYYKTIGRAEYVGVTDNEALEGFKLLCKTEGIIPALESAHAVAYGAKIARKLNKNNVIVVNLSGRGDKDVTQLKENYI